MEPGWSDESGTGTHIIQTAFKAGDVLSGFVFLKHLLSKYLYTSLKSTCHVDQQVLC